MAATNPQPKLEWARVDPVDAPGRLPSGIVNSGTNPVDCGGLWVEYVSVANGVVG